MHYVRYGYLDGLENSSFHPADTSERGLQRSSGARERGSRSVLAVLRCIGPTRKRCRRTAGGTTGTPRAGGLWGGGGEVEKGGPPCGFITSVTNRNLRAMRLLSLRVRRVGSFCDRYRVLLQQARPGPSYPFHKYPLPCIYIYTRFSFSRDRSLSFPDRPHAFCR